MAAAHSRFRRLPGAMRVLAVELCHYVDILFSCAAAVPPAAAAVAPTAADARTAAGMADSGIASEKGGSELVAAARKQVVTADLEHSEQQLRVSSADLGAAAEQKKPPESLQPSVLVPAIQQAAQKPAGEDSDGHKGGQESAPGSEEASSPRPEQSGSQASPAVGHLYEPLVTFVLELLSDADAGAKPAEIAAPLQLHLRALQIAQWQSSSGTTSEQSAQTEGTSAAVARKQLDLAAHAVQRMLRIGTPLTSLRYVVASAKMSPFDCSSLYAPPCCCSSLIPCCLSCVGSAAIQV